ncbi:MAG: hypothetical protein JW893_04920 [Candidatus Omnitrophica bacterium]|nr:hypothetical protein [Candidatus Omnitrophota bacterium]
MERREIEESRERSRLSAMIGHQISQVIFLVASTISLALFSHSARMGLLREPHYRQISIFQGKKGGILYV